MKKITSKIYLAGSCDKDKRKIMQGIAKYLREMGYETYCPFELKIPNAWSYSQEDWAQLVFEADKNAILECDIFLMITPGRQGTAGTNWEQGFIYGLQLLENTSGNHKPKQIIVIQYTDSNTSLMTFCGCDVFLNTDKEHLLEAITKAVKGKTSKGKCLTTLT